MHKTSAWPLSQAYVALIVYASLYPFSGWRFQGVAPWAFLASPLPRYWTGFDILSNLAGYAPLGFLLALTLRRRDPGMAGRPGDRRGMGAAVLLAALACGLLSLLMEGIQTWLPSRVASNLDLALNTAGALGGALAAVLLERLGALDRWGRFRDRWFLPDSRGALTLLALWPPALLFPAAVPLGLGQVFERMEAAMAGWLAETPFIDWLPLRDLDLQPLVPGAEMLCVALGLLVPCLLGYSVLRSPGRRLLFAPAVLLVGVSATALSAAMTWGPVHAWTWLSTPVAAGLGLGVVLAGLALPVPRRGCAAVAMLALMLHLAVLNQAPASAYFSQTLQTWEQGRFIRFHGLAQWLGWIWPYAALAYVLMRVSSSERAPRIRS